MKITSAAPTVLLFATTECLARSHEARGANDTAVLAYIPTRSEHVNIFSSLTQSEQDDVTDFLTAQQNETLFGDYYAEYMFTLLPNKTDALRYLDENGPQPARYAHVSLQWPCYSREYMVGPLPVDNKTTELLPLDYMYNGNATQDMLGCNDDNSDIPGDGGLDDPYGEEQGWTGDELPFDQKAAPITILPDGPRHLFDPEENFVSWMDFTFFTTVGQAGLALYDIRYQGERIIYELALQEALAHYAGVDPDAASTAYLDVSIGFQPGKLVPGYDCPSYATYAQNGTYCLFEFPKNFPMQRHTDYNGNYHVTNNIAFLLRAVSTVGNYDYQITYEFYLDGSIQVIARASGYIAWTSWTDDPLDPSYGYHIRPNNSGSMHDHVLNFKLDLDIHGTANSLLRTEFIPTTTTYPWSNNTAISTMSINRSFVPSESLSKINWSPNAAAAYAVVNTDTPNQYGELPGYRIYPSLGSAIHSTIINSTLMGNTINWATHHLYALQRHDSEPSSTSYLNTNNIHDPLVDFNTFFLNNESLQQEDLVLYFNLGMHHMPDTGDLPTTVFTNAQSGVMIRPVNYMERDASQRTRQQVNVTVGTGDDGEGVSVDEYGQGQPSGLVDLGTLETDLQAVFADDEADGEAE